jgi:hypothetical protein
VAATYDPTLPSAQDRVRFLVSDRAARFDFQDEEIVYTLTLSGFDEDPLATTEEEPIPEIQAAIALIESMPSASTTGDSVTIKTLTTTRTNASGIKDRSGILRALYRRLRVVTRESSGGGMPAVADGYPEYCWRVS